MTGDVVINIDAPTLIMTTEIFRNIIFDDTDRLRNVRYVIFDEIHYIDDIERGTVWEESVIFAPQHVNFICLSATIPNLREFAAWMRNVRHSRIDIVSETQRPVPLEHRLYLRGYGLGLPEDLEGIQKAIEGRPKNTERRSSRSQKVVHGRRAARETQVMRPVATGVEELAGADLIDHIQYRGQIPCLYFALSRKVCEKKALENIDRDFLRPEEREAILAEYNRLGERYGIQSEVSAKNLRRLVEHGVAYHHAGMLPTLKEVVEQLFTLGCIKLLFTTETFALGVNMPACTVVFDSMSKYDGIQFRYLKAREYHQMAGRAGRRGIDTKGFVYACVDPALDGYREVKRVVSGDMEKLESQFNLSYNSVLNLYDKHGESIYDICDKSLGNHQNVRILKQLDHSLAELKERKEESGEPTCKRGGDVKELLEYRRLERELKTERDALRPRKSLHRHGQKRRKRQSIARRVAQLAKMVKTFRCHKCMSLRQCAQLAAKIESYDSRISELSEQKEFAKNYQRQQIAGRLALLNEMGYMNASGLMPRGEVASQIYGYELQITELLFGGHLHRLAPDLLNVLIMAVVFESKRGCWYSNLGKSIISPVLSGPTRRMKKIRLREKALGIDVPLKEMDAKLSSALYEWSKGCTFDELADYTDAPPGDLVRYFRLASDLLRQTKRVVSKEDPLFDKISACIGKINRDVVDAERQLRAR